MKKSICFFANSMFRIGGEQRITSIIANGLIKNDYDVSIIIKTKEDIDYNLYGLSPKIKLIFLNYSYDFRLNNIKLFEKLRNLNRKYGLFKNNKKLIRHFFCSNKMINDLKRIFNDNHFDVVVGVAGDRSFILSYLKEHIKSKLIFWNHQNIDAHYKNKESRYYMEESFIKPLISRFDDIVVQTNDDKEKLDRLYNVNCTIIYNCKSFVSNEKSKLDNRRFLAAGRLVNQKGFDYLIAAMKIYCENNGKWELDIYGDGELKEFLNELIIKNHLEGKVKLFPSTSDLKNIYLNHDIFLMSSRYEGFGLVTLEALECGLPVIAFDISANREIIQNGVTGRLVGAYDVKKFGEAMIEFSESKKQIIDMQRNIDESINKFSEDNILELWVNIVN